MSGTFGAPPAGDGNKATQDIGTFADALTIDGVDEVRLVLTGAAPTSSKQPAQAVDTTVMKETNFMIMGRGRCSGEYGGYSRRGWS